MSEHIHTVPGVEPGTDLGVTEFAGESSPALHLEVTDPAGAACMVASYAEVESLHHALGAWLLDCLVTGRVTPDQRGPHA